MCDPAVVVAIFSVLIIVFINRKEWKKKVFTFWYVRSQKLMLKCSGKYRKNLFERMSSLRSADPDLAKDDSGALRILEIGVGPCCNLEYYPEGSRLISVDPNENFLERFNENKAKYPHVVLEKHYKGFGEDMSGIADGSVDVVVVTYVFCSVNSVPRVLEEAFRVLVPGGKMFFLEHVAAKRPIFKLAQKLIQPLWSIFTDDCRLTVPVLEYIQQSDFEIEFYNYFVLSEAMPLPFVLPCIMPNLMGVARKP